MPRYVVASTKTPPPLDGPFATGAWAQAAEGRVANFWPVDVTHRPDTRFRVLHDAANLYVRFEVRDQYVRAVSTKFQDMVCFDSCVEFFLRPRADAGYFNFEVSAGGVLLLSYIEDATRVPGGFKKFQRVSADWGARVKIWHSLPVVVEPEIAEPTTWGVGYAIPVALLEAYTGPLGKLAPQVWRANFYKCGDHTSHPHWATWAPIAKLNFHQPECFGELEMS